ncbi:hypothetical protein LINPERHAP2_LOCUS26825 [Linum perenne]
MDSQAAIQILTNVREVTHQRVAEVLISVRKLLLRDWTVSITHVFREGHKVVDFLANIGCKFPLGTHVISCSEPGFNHICCMTLWG